MRERIIVGCVVLWVSVACGLQPVPRVAVEGTTIAIPVPETFEIGYGRVLNGPSGPSLAELMISLSTITGPAVNPSSLDLEDLQRGEVVAILRDGANPAALLKVQYVAGLDADGATEWMRTGEDARARQNILLVDIPKLRANGQALVTPTEKYRVFSIELRRYRRRDLSSNLFDLMPQSAVPQPPTTEWLGWAANGSTDPEDGIMITIVDRPTGLSDTTQGYTSATAYTAADPGSGFQVVSGPVLPEQVIPDAHFAVQLDATSGPYGAVEFDLEYPAERIEITGVRPNRGSGWVSITPSSAGPTDCTPTAGTARVHAADSAGAVSGVIVNFKIKSTSVGCSPALSPVAVDSEIAIAAGTLKVFDLDGVALASVPPPSIVENGI